MKKIIVTIVCILLFSGCSAMKPQADGRYFEFGSNNHSEASVWLEKVVVDGKWNAPATGTLGCGGGRVNGAVRTGSVSYNTPAPQQYIYLEWYAWREMSRMKAKIVLPNKEIVNDFILNPPWLDRKRNSGNKSIFIIDFRPNNIVWIKLAKGRYPKSEDEVMILAEGKGVKTSDRVTRYSNYKEGENYELDCSSFRKRIAKLGGSLGTTALFDKWYTEFLEE